MKKGFFYYFALLLICACQSNQIVRTEHLIEGKSRKDYEARSKNFMISSQGESTSKAALFIYERKGNIVDAAIAASLAISVERPHSTGLGGGGFLLLKLAGKADPIAFDFREMAPHKAFSRMYLDNKGKQIKEKSLTGALASGTPGLIAGLYEIHKKYGKLPWKDLFVPAIKLAEEGFEIYPALATAIDYSKDRLCQYPSSEKIFYHKNCTPKKAGELLIQEDLAQTLKLIAKYGRKAFYEGIIAQKIVRSQKKYHGLMDLKDLKNYQVKVRKPVIGEYKEFKIASMPSPSSGGVHIIQILNILENFKLDKKNPLKAQNIHLVASAMQRAFADRAEHMGDADFKKIPVDTLISKKYAKYLASSINANSATPGNSLGVSIDKFKKEPEHTTHFTIADGKGNIVSSTQTINGWFGSALVAEGTGIVMNNEMDDFASNIGGVNLFGAIGGKNNLVEPLKRPLSSMSPTIVYDNEGKPVLALGTPSGTRILTCVMQTILNYIEYGLPLWEAVSMVRIHHQWYPDELRIGPKGLGKDTEEKLTQMGYKINHKSLGCKIQAISFEDGELHGVSDPREEGLSIGR